MAGTFREGKGSTFHANVDHDLLLGRGIPSPYADVAEGVENPSPPFLAQTHLTPDEIQGKDALPFRGIEGPSGADQVFIPAGEMPSQQPEGFCGDSGPDPAGLWARRFRVCPGGRFHGGEPPRLVQAMIGEYAEVSNGEARPWVWTKSADET